ncbi:hypothetical protein CVV72_41140 (plasmid) [Amycolatopsis sp. TNS106]|nr:hypothetical protein CVV72_41140 [Amycolatopsis sp. TNS106]
MIRIAVFLIQDFTIVLFRCPYGAADAGAVALGISLRVAGHVGSGWFAGVHAPGSGVISIRGEVRT